MSLLGRCKSIAVVRVLGTLYAGALAYTIVCQPGRLTGFLGDGGLGLLFCLFFLHETFTSKRGLQTAYLVVIFFLWVLGICCYGLMVLSAWWGADAFWPENILAFVLIFSVPPPRIGTAIGVQLAIWSAWMVLGIWILWWANHAKSMRPMATVHQLFPHR